MKQITIDLNKVQYATFGWENEFGMFRDHKPLPTYLGQNIPATLVNDSNRHKLDTWKPVVKFQFAANHAVCYYGNRAVSLWKAWNEKVFSKQMKQDRRK